MKAVIVIGTYNDEYFIEKTIHSVQTQKYTNWECILVDNGSTDNTHSVVQGLIKNDARFKSFKKANEGPASGRNFAIKKIDDSFKYVHFLDGDDFLDESFLEIMISYMEAHPNIGLLGCQFDVVDTKSNFVQKGYRSRYAPNKNGFPVALKPKQHYTPFETFFSATGQGPFALFKTEILKRTSGYEEDFWSHEDSDIFCQMALLADVHYLPNYLYKKRVHGNNLTFSPKASYSKFRNKWDFYISDDEEINLKIEKALRYYYGWHAPLRSIKVGKKAMKEFFKNKELFSFKKSLTLFKNGFIDLVFKSTLNKRLKDRNKLKI